MGILGLQFPLIAEIDPRGQSWRGEVGGEIAGEEKNEFQRLMKLGQPT
jgi:hypothetical protein